MLSASLGVGALAASGLLLSACTPGKPVPVPSDDDATDIGAVVRIGDNWYEPAHVTIAPGQAVRWEWTGREQHDVIAGDRSFVSELQREGSYTHVFDEGGEYHYLCSIHPEMRGLVAVS